MNYNEKLRMEYDKLLTRDDISRELIEHPKFYEQFRMMYHSLSQNGSLDFPVNVEYDKANNNVIIMVDSEVPDYKEEPFHGYSGYSRCTFGLEQSHDKKYLCVRKYDGSIYKMSNENMDYFSYSTSLDVYDDYLNAGRMVYIGSQNVKRDFLSKKYIPQIVPELEVSHAIQGILPNQPNYADVHRCYVESIGMCSGDPGIAVRSIANNDPNKYDERKEYVSVSMEDPYSIDKIGTDFIAQKELGDSDFKLPEGSQFRSVDEALNYYISAYDENIKKL